MNYKGSSNEVRELLTAAAKEGYGIQRGGTGHWHVKLTPEKEASLKEAGFIFPANSPKTVVIASTPKDSRGAYQSVQFLKKMGFGYVPESKSRGAAFMPKQKLETSTAPIKLPYAVDLRITPVEPALEPAPEPAKPKYADSSNSSTAFYQRTGITEELVADALRERGVNGASATELAHAIHELCDEESYARVRNAVSYRLGSNTKLFKTLSGKQHRPYTKSAVTIFRLNTEEPAAMHQPQPANSGAQPEKDCPDELLATSGDVFERAVDELLDQPISAFLQPRNQEQLRRLIPLLEFIR